jgi:Cu(I)/Ag(I) efflux system membrane protein CusA/SilA
MLFARIEPFTFRPRFLARAWHQPLVGRYRLRGAPPMSRFLHRSTRGRAASCCGTPRATILAAVLAVLTTIPVYLRLGSEFMPPLREGTMLYMPSAVEPGMSVAEAQKALQLQDKILMSFPEVERVFGKAGRANTPTDPAPLTMMETTVLLRPESSWRQKPRWYSAWAPAWLQAVLRPLWRDRIEYGELEDQMNRALQLPGISNAWTMPIKGRLDMLSTGIRTPVGIKVLGSDLAVIERVGRQVEAAVRAVPGARSVYAERVAGGWFLDYVLKRDQLARHGLSVDDANLMVMTAVGGDNQSVTIEGRERYGINVRYARDYRQDLPTLRRVLLPLPSGEGQIPMEEIADVVLTQGPSMIRDENGLLTGYVYVDFDTGEVDVGRFVDHAKAAVRAGVVLPTGYALSWSGQWENMQRVEERLGSWCRRRWC